MYKKILLLVILLLVFCSLSFAGELISKEAVTYYNAGVKAQKGANFVEADVNYSKALLLDPNNLTYQKCILNNRGIIFAQMGDLDQSEAAFKMALQIDPKYKPAKLNLGLINEKRRSRCESLEYWAKIFNFEKLKPKNFVIADEQGEQETAKK